MKAVSAWGRLSRKLHHVVALHDVTTAPAIVSDSAQPAIPHGMGRSYGDQALNAGGTLWQTTGLNKFITFDEATGQLTCEAGVLLGDIQRLTVPRGWMLPVSPGTQLVTVGGAIANDVHGKNHHVMGTFGEHVLALTLVRTSGEVICCSPSKNPGWLAATLGGMGLTGLITQAQLQLRPVAGPWLTTQTIAFRGLAEFFQLADHSESDWEYTVAWLDCLSGNDARGLFMRANHSNHTRGPEPSARQLAMPVTPPLSLVNRLTLRPFNLAYYHLKKKQRKPQVIHYAPFLYPLDGIAHWNRMYGPRGFYQYQSVVPRSAGKGATEQMLNAIAQANQGSFLAVLKTFDARQASRGLLSFPQPGVTLALDFPNRGSSTHKLFARLDAIVREAGGRIYAAKDARMPADLFAAGYPRLAEFMPFRDPGISSDMSRRLFGT